MIRQSLLFVALVWVAAGSSAVEGQAPAPAAQPADAAVLQPNDYTDGKSWLCRPGRKGDACDVDLTTTVIAADGTMTQAKRGRRIRKRPSTASTSIRRCQPTRAATAT